MPSSTFETDRLWFTAAQTGPNPAQNSETKPRITATSPSYAHIVHSANVYNGHTTHCWGDTEEVASISRGGPPITKDTLALLCNGPTKVKTIWISRDSVFHAMVRLFLLGEGVSGHCLIWASGMLPPKLRPILDCLAFSTKKNHQKMYPTPVKSLFENTMENFFSFLF